MASVFESPRVGKPRASFTDRTWMVEIAATEQAVDLLLFAKRTALRDDPEYEQVLWARHVERLREIKRKLDAVCM